MKRILIYMLAALAAIALFAGLVHMVLVVADVSKPAATTVYGLTQRRQWALVVLAVALVSGLSVGGLSVNPLPVVSASLKGKGGLL
jgi:phosphate/sulfate permease